MLRLLKRLKNFDKQDWKHVTWLLKNMIKYFFLLEPDGACEAYCLLKLHLFYNSRRK